MVGDIRTRRQGEIGFSFSFASHRAKKWLEEEGRGAFSLPTPVIIPKLNLAISLLSTSFRGGRGKERTRGKWLVQA